MSWLASCTHTPKHSYRTECWRARKGKPNQNSISIYLPEPVMAEVRAEADRTGRSVSWLLGHAWLATRERFKTLPDLVTPRPAPPAEEK